MVTFQTSGNCQNGGTATKYEYYTWYLAWGGYSFSDAISWPASVNYPYMTLRKLCMAFSSEWLLETCKIETSITLIGTDSVTWNFQCAGLIQQKIFLKLLKILTVGRVVTVPIFHFLKLLLLLILPYLVLSLDQPL